MNVLLVQTSIGDYRQKVLEELVGRLGSDFNVICGPHFFYPSLKTNVDIGGQLKLIKNFFFANNKLLFQPRAVLSGLRPDVIILELNPRILSNWIVLFMRKLVSGKKSVLWGHAWSRKGKESSTDRVRNFMRSLGDAIIVYTETQKDELTAHMGDRPFIIAAPNSLYRKAEMVAVQNPNRRAFIYVGRLVEDKKPQLLIRAFALFRQRTQQGKLIIVGDGPLKETCETLAAEILPDETFEFTGHVGSMEILRTYYSQSLASVSPGYVGLSITQSFGFGVPMIIARNEPHAPEIETAENELNCLFFDEDDENALCNSMISMWDDRQTWIEKADMISESCRNTYSVEVMAERIVSAVTHGN